MSYHLFVDDERDPPGDGRDWVVARSARDARGYVETLGPPSFASFDHDLGGDTPTGYDFVRWFAEFIMDNDLPYTGFDWYVHSQNPVGAENINRFLKNFLPVWKEGAWKEGQYGQ